MSPSGVAHLVGPDGQMRGRIADALLEAGWDVAATASVRGRLDLAVFIPTGGASTPLAGTSPADWWSTVGENLTSAFHCARALIPRLSRSGGALVFVSSVLGEIGAPDRTAFCAAAAGIIGLVKGLTVEVPGVRFSAVAPAFPVPEEPWGAADVDWHPPSGAPDATSVARATADAVLFLAGDREGHHRGQVIRIPSGITT